MSVTDLVREFCVESGGKYSICENYSGRFMFGRECLGIIVRNGNNHMEMVTELARYFCENDFDFDFDGVSVDSLGLDTIVYFPNIRG